MIRNLSQEDKQALVDATLQTAVGFCAHHLRVPANAIRERLIDMISNATLWGLLDQSTAMIEREVLPMVENMVENATKPTAKVKPS
jgi:hypothetical protein